MPTLASLVSLRTWALVIAGLALAPSAVQAQQWPDRVRGPALRDFHGPDLKGKDGPLAKAGLDLLLLHHAHRQGGSVPSGVSQPVQDGYVTIDAIATTDAAALRRDLDSLGLKQGATAGRLVSGRFPLARIPDLARLASLRGVMVARAQTRPRRNEDREGAPQVPDRTAPQPRPSPPGTPSPPRIDSTRADSFRADSVRRPSVSPLPARRSSSRSDSGDGAMGLLALLAAVALGLDEG